MNGVNVASYDIAVTLGQSADADVHIDDIVLWLLFAMANGNSDARAFVAQIAQRPTGDLLRDALVRQAETHTGASIGDTVLFETVSEALRGTWSLKLRRELATRIYW